LSCTRTTNAFYRRGLVYAEIRIMSTRLRTSASRSGSIQAALDDCNEALRLRPTLTDAFDSRGLTQLKLGHYRQAVSDFDAALQSNPKQVSSLYGRGKAKLKAAAALAVMPTANRLRPWTPT
jgi:tetratricopeptide (TPR) repeat protein